MKYAITNATSFSTLPLQLVTIMGGVSILFSVILAIQTLVRYLMGTSVEGFTTVILLILIIGGFIMLSLGVIGHYIARIYLQNGGNPTGRKIGRGSLDWRLHRQLGCQRTSSVVETEVLS